MQLFRRLLILLFLAAITSEVTSAQANLSYPKRVTISGTVYDTSTLQPVPFATVRVVNSGRSATANDQGQYRLVVAPGDTCQLKYSHIAYYSGQVTIVAADVDITQDIYLHPTLIELNTIRVSSGARDPGEAIIVEAIKRKEEILNRLHDYRFDAYTKLVVRGKKKDTVRVLLITESQVSSFWEQPDKYKEIITARKQTKNLPADANLVAVGDILNFNKDRIDLGDEQVVSPTAHDALDHYRYYLLDTLQIDGARVFVLEVEPKSDVNPLFTGQIQIVDSTFDVVGVDFGFNQGFHPPMLSNLRYTQRFASYHDRYWMPVEIHFSGDVKLPFPIPGVPSEMTFEHIASLYSYQFEAGTPIGTFGEIAREVAPEADQIDSASWAVRQTIPLTDEETLGYRRIDSTQRAPKPFLKQMIRLTIALPILLSTQERFFHFNRVEGAYLGIGGTARLNPGLSLALRGGYAFGTEKGQYEGELAYMLWQPGALQLQLMYHRRVMHRPAFYFPADKNMTMSALADGSDPFDYFDERGYRIQVSGRVVNRTRLSFGYHHYRQSSLATTTDYSVFEPSDPIRVNPDIANGSLRAVSMEFRYDSRPMYRLKGRDVFGEASVFTQFSVAVERSSPGWLDSDFNYTRFSARFYRRQNTLGLGQTSMQLTGGIASRGVPPQRYFSVPFSPMNDYLLHGMQTLHGRNFGGTEALSVTLRHRFGTRLFRWSGLPLIKRLPFEVSIHGGVFWADFAHHDIRTGDEWIREARTAYSEIGFGLERLIPSLSPLDIGFFATWQLSAYDTNRYTLSWKFGF